MLKNILFLFCLSLLFTNNVYSQNIEVFSFTEEELKTLKVKKIKKFTEYQIGSNANGNFLRAKAEGQASGLGKEIKINLDKTPFINITWKVEKNLNGINERSKKGHDFAARVFVVKKTGITALSNRAINYVFSSNEDIGENWSSPYTKNSIDYVLSTTKINDNEWITVKSNVKNDFKNLHNLDVNEIDGVAILTDTDNSKMKAVSYYQNIYFSSE